MRFIYDTTQLFTFVHTFPTSYRRSAMVHIAKRFINSASAHVTMGLAKMRAGRKRHRQQIVDQLLSVVRRYLISNHGNIETLSSQKKSHRQTNCYYPHFAKPWPLHATCNPSSASTILIGYINRPINTSTVVFQLNFSKKRFHF